MAAALIKHSPGGIKMLMLFMDAAVLMLLVAAVNDNEEVELGKALIVGIILSIVCGLSLNAAAAAYGMTGLLLAVVPVAALAGGVAWIAFGLTLTRAMILGACYLIYRIGASFAMAWAFG